MGNQLNKEQPTNDGLPNFHPIKRGDPHWLPTAKKCHECGESFGPFVWRQHCEACGSIFCSRCCYPRKILKNHNGCGMCVAEACVMIRQMYDAKRKAQLHQHSVMYHPEEHPEEYKQLMQEIEREKEVAEKAHEVKIRDAGGDPAVVMSPKRKQVDGPKF